MPRKYFKWTPEAVERLRQLQGTMRVRDIAARLGCTRWAVMAKTRELRRLTSSLDAMEPAERFARRYMVRRKIVEFVGVAALDAMDEKTRRSTLWGLRRKLDSKRDQPETFENVERMMYLTERLAKWR